MCLEPSEGASILLVAQSNRFLPRHGAAADPDRGAGKAGAAIRPREVIRIKSYEIMLLIEPEVAEERHGEIIDRIKDIVEKGAGTWGDVEPWGKRRLAYEIRHQTEAFYYVITFESPAEALAETQRVLAITDGVMRFMAVNRVTGSSAAKPEESAHPPVEATA